MSVKQSACSQECKCRSREAEGKAGWLMVAGAPSRRQCQQGPGPSSPSASNLHQGSLALGTSSHPNTLHLKVFPVPNLPGLLKLTHLFTSYRAWLFKWFWFVWTCHPFFWCSFEIDINLLLSWNQIGIDVFIRTASINMTHFLVNCFIW